MSYLRYGAVRQPQGDEKETMEQIEGRVDQADEVQSEVLVRAALVVCMKSSLSHG